jgi:putative acetyltransferase
MRGASVVCRAEAAGERDDVAHIVRRAFADERVVDLVEDLRGSPDWVAELALVACIDARPVAFLACSRGLLDAPRALLDVLVLSPVAVLPEHQRQGVGSALISRAIAVARGRGERLVFIEGDPRYYHRFGFRAAGELGFRRPSLRIPPAAFQVLVLERPDPSLTGTLVYPRAFWDHDCVGLREPA